MQRSAERVRPDQGCGPSRGGPAVLVVDADISVREALVPLISLSGWQAQTFAPGRVPGALPGSPSELPPAGLYAAGLMRFPF